MWVRCRVLGELEVSVWERVCREAPRMLPLGMPQNRGIEEPAPYGRSASTAGLFGCPVRALRDSAMLPHLILSILHGRHFFICWASTNSTPPSLRAFLRALVNKGKGVE